MTTRKRNISIHKIILLEHSRGWDYVRFYPDTWVWAEGCGVFPARMMKRKDKKKFKMRYRDMPF